MREDDVPYTKPEYWVYVIISFVLVLFAGVTSGLALGLLSFSKVDLAVQIKAGRPQDRKNAAKILPIVKNEHLLLCTLLISKSLAMEALPIFLDSIFPAWGAILMSVTLVVAFVEIIPQAVCSRYGLSLGAKLSAFVRLLLWVFFPISYPFSKLLDCLLGKEHPALFRRAELKTLVGLHANEAGKGGELSHHETSIITGALDLTQKTAKDAMTPISEIFSLDINSKLDMHTMGSIISKGHSRIPIYSGSPSNIIGLVLVKHLIFCRPQDGTPIKHITIKRIPRVHEDWPLYDILNQFLKGHGHMAAVIKSKNVKEYQSPVYYSSDTEYQSPAALKNPMEKDKYLVANTKNWKQGDENIISFEELESLQSNTEEEVVGIITMEDVMEELLQEEISDETDEYADVRTKIRMHLLSSRRSSSRSPGRFTPLSSYSPMAILRSPLSPFVQPPLVRPILSTSPGKGKQTLNSQGAGSAPHVSRMSYEKLRQLYGYDASAY